MLLNLRGTKRRLGRETLRVLTGLVPLLVAEGEPVAGAQLLLFSDGLEGVLDAIGEQLDGQLDSLDEAFCKDVRERRRTEQLSEADFLFERLAERLLADGRVNFLTLLEQLLLKVDKLLQAARVV